MRYISRLSHRKADIAYLRLFVDSGLNCIINSVDDIIEVTDYDSGKTEVYDLGMISNAEVNRVLDGLAQEGVYGINCCKDEHYILSVYPKRNFALKKCLNFVEDIKSNLPKELLSLNNSRFTWKTPVSMYPTQDTYVCQIDMNDYAVNHETHDIHSVEALIIHYMSDFLCRGVEMLNYNIDSFVQIYACSDLAKIAFLTYEPFAWFKDGVTTAFDKDSFRGRDYIDCYVQDDVVYRMRKDALFQCVGCPLYISQDGDLYLGYSRTAMSISGLVGALHYKINDISKFNNIITKCKMLTKQDSMCLAEHLPLLPATFYHLTKEDLV